MRTAGSTIARWSRHATALCIIARWSPITDIASAIPTWFTLESPDFATRRRELRRHGGRRERGYRGRPVHGFGGSADRSRTQFEIDQRFALLCGCGSTHGDRNVDRKRDAVVE